MVEKSNAVQASHPDRIVRGFLLCLSPLGGGMTASARQRSNRVPHLPKPVVDAQSCDRALTTATAASGPACSEEQDGGGGRNARATSSRLRAVLEYPPATHPRKSPAAASSAAIIQRAQERSRFAEPTLRQFVATRNTKNFIAC